MNWFKITKKKELILCRGCPGSGKSFLAKQLVGNTGVSFASDDFFTDSNGNYNFDVDKLTDAHKWNRERVLEAIKKNISPIIWDNTNITMDELKFTLPAIKLAEEKGYQVRIEEPKTPWAFDIDELEKRNTHGVPRDAIQKKIDEWIPDVTVEDIKEHYEKYGPGQYELV